jgi:uncharacterized membrane protein YphA (DoxX/SURF4 family)
MKDSSYHILRVGIAITFLWIGLLIFKEPAFWGGMLEPWAAGLVPVPLEQAMIGTAILDLTIGLALLLDLYVWLAALIGSIHLIIVLTTTGITPITVRDIGLLTGTFALLYPDAKSWWIKQFKG